MDYGVKFSLEFVVLALAEAKSNGKPEWAVGSYRRYSLDL